MVIEAYNYYLRKTPGPPPRPKLQDANGGPLLVRSEPMLPHPKKSNLEHVGNWSIFHVCILQ